jgi:hypothetical protein
MTHDKSAHNKKQIYHQVSFGGQLSGTRWNKMYQDSVNMIDEYTESGDTAQGSEIGEVLVGGLHTIGSWVKCGGK